LDFEYFFTAVDHMVREDGSGLLLLFDKILTSGFEGDTFINGLSQHLRNLIYCKQEPTLQLLQMSDSLRQRYGQQADVVAFSTLLTALSLFNDADVNYPKAKDKRLHIEITLLKACYMSRQIQTLDISTEKKNDEVKQQINAPSSRPTTPSTNVNVPNQQKVEQVGQEITEPNPSAKPKEELPVNKEVKDIPKVELKEPSKKLKNTLQNTPSISSIDHLIESARKELANKKSEVKPLILLELEALWQEYLEQVESTTSKTIMGGVQLSIIEDRIVGYVPSSIAKEEIQQETALYTKIREHFNQNDLSIELVVDREKFPEVAETAIRKLYTTKEKYEHLKSINPLLDDFIDSLQLKPEE
jgi:DNA polymerase-3 subunit gamma/tau